MKKLVHGAVYTALVSILVLYGVSAYATSAYAASVQITLPGFPITLNGIQIENAARPYPLVVYKGITYFPMTYNDSRFLGLESNYTPQTGLDIRHTGIAGNFDDDQSMTSNPQKATAQTAAFSIRVNGKPIDNNVEEYPLLLYRNITYFPLTWRFAVDEFGWEYHFDHTSGLVIYSTPPGPVALPSPGQIADLVDEAVTKLQRGEWLNATLRSFSRYENRIYGIIHEHRPSAATYYQVVEQPGPGWPDNTANPQVIGHILDRDGQRYISDDGSLWTPINDTDFTLPGWFTFAELPDMMDALERLRGLPKDTLDNVWADTDEGYLRLQLSFLDEEPQSMPSELSDVRSPGYFYRHTFYFDLRERCLRSYWVSQDMFFIEDDGVISFIAPPTTYYHVIDLGYQPFAIPSP